MYVKTNTILDKILAHKAEEVAQAARQTPLAVLRQSAEDAPPPRDLLAALRCEDIALIAEVKKASPSKGVLIQDFDPVALGKTYAENGAAAISVLTDVQFFQGSLAYMTAVRAAVGVPVLRKDFIITAYQVYEGRAAIADAILLIVAALDDAQLRDLHTLAGELGMKALVEVHDESELERALKLDAKLIGVNNRDLKHFEVDLQTTAHLAAHMPDDVTLVAESGIRSAADVAYMGQLGAHAVLVGESLVKVADANGDLAATVRQFSSQPRP